MNKIIKNSKGETAIIFKINANTFNPEDFKDLETENLPANYRRFLFIDDVLGSLDSNVINKFQIIFEKYGLNCKKFNGGKVFYIDYFTIEKSKDIDEDLRPRHGQDGGVVGICN